TAPRATTEAAAIRAARAALARLREPAARPTRARAATPRRAARAATPRREKAALPGRIPPTPRAELPARAAPLVSAAHPDREVSSGARAVTAETPARPVLTTAACTEATIRATGWAAKAAIPERSITAWSAFRRTRRTRR